MQLTRRALARAEAAPSDAAMVVRHQSPRRLSTIRCQVGYYAALAPTATGGQAPAAQGVGCRPASGSGIDVILDIDLPLVVRFGRTELPLRALTRLGPGSVIDLGRSPDDPVEVLVSNRVVARGEVVIVGGNYGIRILDVVSPSERMRSMEA